ncbi:Fibronectin domain-containing protein, partial [Oryctes borbonicus]
LDRPARPGKPQLIVDTDGTPDVITIRWDRPLKDGGSPITGYLVEHRRTGSPHWVRASPLLVPFPELTLSGLEPGWRYQFRVSAENAVGLSDPSELSEPLTVTLQRSAVTSPRFTQELTDTTALESDKVEFVVYFLGQPPPKVSWFKDGFEIFSSRRIRILTECDRSVLTIHQSQLVDAGEIRCSATNKAGHASTKAILTLEAPPTIRLPRQYEDGLLFEIGEVIRLKISIAGLPVPLVFWSHNGESIQNSERYEIENSDNSTTLRITEAKRSDRGEYQVKALNKLGQDRTSFLVTVTDKPSPPGKARVLMTLGKSVTLAWNTPVDDGGCKIGNYIIEYYRLGWDVWLKAVTSRQLNAVLGDLIEGSQYKFRVKAESPYGISDPSEESDVVFIPDKKRGILEPPPRSASQPRETAVGRETIPELPQRRNKPRSQSTSRAEDHHVQFNIPNGVPVRPERKLKSPQRTPEASPGVIRRELKPEAINKDIFDRASITRDITYGTPGFKITTSEQSIATIEVNPVAESPEATKPKGTIQVIDNRRPRSPSPMKAKSPSPPAAPKQLNKPLVQTLQVERSKSPTPEKILEQLPRSRSPTPQKIQRLGREERSPSPVQNNRLQNTRSPSPNFARKASKDFTGSSEFMLVLLPNGNKEREAVDIDVSFDENQIPPPLSLSAPELGTEPPIMEGLKYSSSSTELLHERAMIRFYEAAKAEELELKKKLEKKDSQERRPSIIPKIQINSQDEDDFNLERKLSLRRRYSAGITAPQQVLWSQRRHSLRNSDDLTEIFEGKLKKYPMSLEVRREIMMSRTRSESEEKEEEEFEKIRTRMSQKPSTSSDKKKVNVADLSTWDHYDESISGSSEDERIYDQVPELSRSEDEEDSTYHPLMQGMTERRVTSEPFEILTKPNKLPDPNFVPKPILKRSA